MGSDWWREEICCWRIAGGTTFLGCSRGRKHFERWTPGDYFVVFLCSWSLIGVIKPRNYNWVNLNLQKKLAPSVFKIGCSQAGKNKWVEMGKQVSRKVIQRYHCLCFGYAVNCLLLPYVIHNGVASVESAKYVIRFFSCFLPPCFEMPCWK